MSEIADQEMKNDIAEVMKNAHTTITFSSTIPTKLWLKRYSRHTGKSTSEICSNIINEFIKAKNSQATK